MLTEPGNGVATVKRVPIRSVKCIKKLARISSLTVGGGDNNNDDGGAVASGTFCSHQTRIFVAVVVVLLMVLSFLTF